MYFSINKTSIPMKLSKIDKWYHCIKKVWIFIYKRIGSIQERRKRQREREKKELNHSTKLSSYNFARKTGTQWIHNWLLPAGVYSHSIAKFNSDSKQLAQLIRAHRKIVLIPSEWKPLLKYNLANEKQFRWVYHRCIYVQK